MGSKITINGKTYVGNNIQMFGDKVYIDGKLQEEGVSGTVEVVVKGDLSSLTCDGSATVHGNIHGDVDAGGSIRCDNIKGDADAGGSISAAKIEGNADAGGSINMGTRRNWF